VSSNEPITGIELRAARKGVAKGIDGRPDRSEDLDLAVAQGGGVA
jgi:hypothetical protein